MMDNTEESLGRSVDFFDRKDVTQYLSEETMSLLTKLDNVWDEIGIDLEERKRKGIRVVEHVKLLFDEMLKEAKDYKNALAETVTSLLEELSRLGNELRIDIAIDLDGYESIPLNTVISNLEEKIKKYKNMHTAILSEINDLNEKAEIVFHKLGKKDKFIKSSPVPTREDIKAFQIYLDDMIAEVHKRENMFKKTKIEIIKILTDLGIKTSLEFEKNVLKETEATFLFTDENMNLLENWHRSLKSQQEDVNSKIDDLREKVCMFWERLEESAKKRSDFLNAYPGNSMATYRALKEEEIRCKESVKANIKLIVDKMRQEIINWWEQCYYGDEQKKEFFHFDTDCYTEDLLTLHEMYIDKLKKYFHKNKPIYDLISKRTELWKRLLELEERAINPDRLKNRGGQLLREEKERNSVRAKLPKVEENLISMIEAYEAEYQKPFTILGQLVTEMIENDREQFKENRHIQLSAKKQAREKCKTPMKSPLRVGIPQLKTLGTPKTPPKRKIIMSLFGSSSAKKNKSSAKKVVPKIQVNGSAIKRASLERRKRLERKRHSGKYGPKSSNSTETDYARFEFDLETKSTTCRSTLGTQLGNNNNAGPSGTNTMQRTPSRSNLRSKSPLNAASRLTPAPGNLPIII